MERSVVGSDEKDEEASKDEKISDMEPVVYQLVRVEVDGRLVPATDDEVMEVEQLLEGEKSELASANTIKHDGGCHSNVLLLNNPDLEGVTQSENGDESRRLDAKIEEERVRLVDKSLNCSSKFMVVDDQSSAISKISKLGINKLESEKTSSRVPSFLELNNSQIVQVGIAETGSEAQNKEVSGKSSVPKSCTSSLPDFSIIKGEICLDNFSIKELQEAFRATFGRQTCVKDKLWLKRRIAMGLTNSSHVPSTNFIIKDNKIVLIGEKKETTNLQLPKSEDDCLSLDIHVINVTPGNIEAHLNEQIVDEQGSCKRSRVCPSDEKDAKSQMEQYATKRMRKPTKRYIEELSEIETRECTAKPYPYTKNAEQGHSPSKARTRTVCDYDGHTRTVSTRYMSLEGFSLQVPFALRARRGRPRKDFVALMKHHHSILSDMVETSALVPVQVEDNENGSISRETRSIPVLGFVDEVGRKMENDTLNREQEPNLVHRSSDANGNSVNDNVNAQMPSKTGMRRKHHRAWSLCEVRKLVDGVAKYGAGRWSEIRRLAFASYSYRTSVDLKDKWRNLLRASLAQHQSEKGEKSFRKQTSIPIPTPILYQVRELAKLQAQTGIKLSPRKPVDHEGGSVHGEESGFL